MRVAFYAPLKAPDHPTPSGDRAMARSLMRLLRELGHEVELASRFRSYDRAGDPNRQVRLARLGAALAERYLRAVGDGCRQPPELWFTYHLYHKAPDHLGPRVAAALRIPYVVAEASLAAKQAAGLWAAGHAATLAALERANLVLAMTERDCHGLARAVGSSERLRLLRPFIAIEPFSGLDREVCRRLWAERLSLPTDRPWLLAVAMMRGDVKSRSYALLRQALAACLDRRWLLVVAGDGPARATIEADLATLGPGRAALAGLVAPEDLPSIYGAADLFVWPALAEAYGLALLEAKATGLPVIAGREGGVPEIVEEGVTGLLVEATDPAAMASAIRALLDDEGRRRRLGEAARGHIRRRHSSARAREDLAAALLLAVESYSRHHLRQPVGVA
jgi:glycosyltransferase involved in cell wall biosynthesis